MPELTPWPAIPLPLDARVLLWAAAALWFAGGAVALLAARSALSRSARRLARLEQLANSTSMDLKTLIREGARFQEERCATLAAVALVRERQDLLELRASAGPAYEHAIDLARMGLGAEQLMRTTGLARGEAELLVHLHGREPAQAA
jgi:hypothetical protein